MNKNEIKPCPCCGNTNLRVGCLASCVFGVKCVDFDDNMNNKGCGLEMAVTWPELYPKGCKRTFQAMDKWCLERAIEKWNRRQQQIIPTDLMDEMVRFGNQCEKKLLKKPKKAKERK